MKDNQDLVLLSAVIITAFVIFIINRIRFQNKKRNKTQGKKEIIRRSIINTLSDMESDGVYFIKDGNELPQKWRYDKGNGYTEKFKQKMKSKK